jgi:AcrR family transcriptional regulator
MAVYTHFGSIEELRRAVRRAGFERLRQHLARAGETDDPVADVSVAGWGYCINAIENPNLYRVMFMEAPLDDEDAGVGLDTFESLVRGAQRCIDAGRFGPADPWGLATRLWAMVHGAAALHVAGMFQESDALLVTTASARAFFVDFGDEPEAADRSIAVARARIVGTDWERDLPTEVGRTHKGLAVEELRPQ